MPLPTLSKKKKKKDIYDPIPGICEYIWLMARGIEIIDWIKGATQGATVNTNVLRCGRGRLKSQCQRDVMQARIECHFWS